MLRDSISFLRHKQSTARKAKSARRRIADAIGTTILLVYLGLVCFPQVVFAHSISYRHFHVYSVTLIPAAIHPVLDRADLALSRSEIDDPQRSFRIFLCPNHAAFAFFAPMARTAFGDNLPWIHNIFVNASDIGSDTVTSGTTLHNRRILSGVIAHECTHTLLADRFGQIRMIRTPSWKQEGYCDYIAGSTSFDPSMGSRLLAQGGRDSSPSFYYFQAFTAVSYLIDKQHWTVAQIMETPQTLDAVLKLSQPPQR